VLSVTPDVTASATYQNAPPKPVLPDPSQLTSSFAAMVDSNLPPDPQSSPPPDPAPPPPRAAQDAARQDSVRQDSTRTDKISRDSGSSDKSQPRAADNSRSDDNDPPPPDSSKAAGGNDAPKRSDAKSDDSKSVTSDSSKKSESKSADKTGTEGDSAADALDSVVTAQATDQPTATPDPIAALIPVDRKSTRLNSSHVKISYAVFCLKKKKKCKLV